MALRVSLESLGVYNRIKDSVIGNEKDFKELSVKCYLCQVEGHIAIHCTKFKKIEGNLAAKKN